jgi:hypothetical protein
MHIFIDQTRAKIDFCYWFVSTSVDALKIEHCSNLATSTDVDALGVSARAKCHVFEFDVDIRRRSQNRALFEFGDV